MVEQGSHGRIALKSYHENKCWVADEIAQILTKHH